VLSTHKENPAVGAILIFILYFIQSIENYQLKLFAKTSLKVQSFLNQNALFKSPYLIKFKI